MRRGLDVGRFLDPLILESTGKTRHGRPVRKLSHEFRYVYGDENVGGLVTVPVGFQTDGASSPPWAWRVVPPCMGEMAAVIHDCLYTRQLLDRNICDAIYRHALRDEGVNWLRWFIWAYVRMLGWAVYNRRDPSGLKSLNRKMLTLDEESKT